MRAAGDGWRRDLRTLSRRHIATVRCDPLLLQAGLLGFVGYGLSLTLFVLALRNLGTARTGAYFSLAPFIGAALAVALGAPLTPTLIIASLFMGAGVWLHITESHAHVHRHLPVEHEHSHIHDSHHHNPHPGDWKGEERILICVHTQRSNMHTRTTRMCITGTSIRSHPDRDP
jgi:hypothetical protein